VSEATVTFKVPCSEYCLGCDFLKGTDGACTNPDRPSMNRNAHKGKHGHWFRRTWERKAPWKWKRAPWCVEKYGGKT
jgi:hypothetical protein